MTRVWLGIVLLATLLLAGPATAQLVQTELMLLCDISGSISGTEFVLQRTGYANAFNSVAVQELVAQATGGVAASLVWWSGGDEQALAVDWTHLTDAASCEAFADAIAAAGRPFSGPTAPGSAIHYANNDPGASIWLNSFTSDYQIMDVSGDGIQNEGLNTAEQRDLALAAGIEQINGLAIESTEVYDWYIANVQGGTESFTVFVENFDDFGDAVEQKILREINPIPEPSTLALIGLGILGIVVFGIRRLRRAQ
jgi:hypothetical protein